jgi:hypothetical protein
MFRALFSHLQEALHKQKLVNCVRDMSVACYQDWSGTGSTPILVPTNSHNTKAKYQLLLVQCLLKLSN